jgi:hypothetical protein
MIPMPAQLMEESAIPTLTTAQSRKQLSLDLFIPCCPFMVTDASVVPGSSPFLNEVGRDDRSDARTIVRGALFPIRVTKETCKT